MATTGVQLIEGALSLLGVLANGENASGDEVSGCLINLNNMIDSWNTERLYIYTVQESIATLSGSTLTIGPGQTVNVTRPIALEDHCFTRYNNVDYPMSKVNGEEYSSIILKQQTSTYPYIVYYDTNYPTGTLYFWPVPPAPVEVHLRLMTQLTEWANAQDSHDLPQGYRRALMYSLAEELAPQYRPCDPMISRIASQARRNIKRANTQNNTLNMPTPLLGRRVGFNIYIGE